MHTTKNSITAIVVKKYQKIIRNIQEKRTKKQRAQLQAALMLGGIRRVK